MASTKTGHEAPGILVVDDTPANLSFLCGLLKERGYRARPVPSGVLALQAAAAERPDLILLDIGMPEMDGFEVCKRLKADPRLEKVPVIFLTARTATEDKVKAFALGGVDYVTKPFQFEEVDARVATHLKLVRQRRELQQSYDRLAELEKLRDSLVHMVVHDMRSPLAALIANLGFVKDDLAGKLDEQTAEDIQAALEGASRLNGMANDLLDVSRLEAGRMPIVARECDLARVIAAAVTNVKGMVTGIEVRVDVPAPLVVPCDERVVGRVIENLVSNGLKHAPAGGLLQVGARPVGGGARVTVRDRGPGIPEGLRDKIFEKFGVLEARHEQQYHSVGLGLVFCKLAVEAHGGKIGVDSTEGDGSTFWFELPWNFQP